MLHLMMQYRYQRQNFREKAEMVLRSGVFDVNWKGKSGQTPLSSAIQHGADDIAQSLLLRNDVNIDVADNDGATPLMYAVRRKQLLLTKTLLDRPKVRVNILVSGGEETPLHSPVRQHAYDILDLLLGHKHIQPDLTDRRGHTPFLDALRVKNMVAALMLAKMENINLDARDIHWSPAVHVAIDTDDLRFV